MNYLFYLMGKSSTGKDTIFGRLLKDDELKLMNVVGYTTRPMRESEIDGVEYNFVTEGELKNLKDNGKVIEVRGYNTVHGMWYYATVDDGQIDFSKGNYVLIGTLESFVKVRDYYNDKYKEDVVVPIYIEVEDGERLSRALEREKRQVVPKYAEMCRRFLADSEDFSTENIKKANIKKIYQNNDLEKCISEIKADIKNRG